MLVDVGKICNDAQILLSTKHLMEIWVGKCNKIVIMYSDFS